MNAFCKLGKMSLKLVPSGQELWSRQNFSSNRERWRKEKRRERKRECESESETKKIKRETWRKKDEIG